MPNQPIVPSPRFPKERLIKIVETLSQVQVRWATARRGFLGMRPGTEHAWILLNNQSMVERGVDELRMVYNPTTDQNDLLLVGQRQFTLVVTAISLDPKIEATDLCERVRFGFRRQTARVLMVPTIALRDFGPIVAFPEYTEKDGTTVRTVLRATLDVRLACVVSSDPSDPEEGNYIAKVAVEPGVPGPPGGSGNLIE